MSDDRRSSVRRQATLPFAWCEMGADAATADICNALGLPRALSLQARLADLDETFLRASGGLADPHLADALRALNDKLAVLEEALLAQAPLPPPHALELSADGIGFDAPAPLATGSWIGVHVVLPVSYHVVAMARISHCAALSGSSGHRVGAEFHHLEDPVARRLTRFAISRDRPTA